MSGKSPYYAKLRGFGLGDDWDKGGQFFGDDKTKGVECIVASWDGAVDFRIQVKNGVTWLTVYLIPWGPKDGPKKGVSQTIFDGPIDGSEYVDPQQELF
jgi:hypothetical protein